jgi:hypothetical protein
LAKEVECLFGGAHRAKRNEIIALFVIVDVQLIVRDSGQLQPLI